MTTPTTNFSWQKPVNASDSNNWGNELNALFDAIDTTVFGIQTTANGALPKSGGAMTGALNALTSSMAVKALGNISGAAAPFDLSLAQYFTFTPTAAVTLSLTNVPAVTNTASGLILRITNGGAFGVTWFAGVRWVSGIAPTLTAAGVDMVGFITDDGGTSWRGVLVAKAIA